MKVLQLLKTNEGASWAFSQAQWLYQHGIDIITVLPTAAGGFAQRYRENRMTVVDGDFSLFPPSSIPKKSRQLNQIVEQFQPDLIHCHFVTNAMLARIALRKSGIPRLFQVPGPLHVENGFYRRAEIMTANGNDYWAGACRKTCELYLTEGIPDDRVFLAYYGGATCNTYKDSTNRLHDVYGIPQDCILIGMVSYFYKPKAMLLKTRGIKGHEDFIDAIALVRKQYPSVRGTIIGGPWDDAFDYVERVKAYAEIQCPGGIVFTGFRSDIKEIYRELDIAVHPSHSENLGGAAESLAAGVPTISTDVGGFPDIVVDGVSGFTVHPHCPDALSDAIIQMLRNPDLAIRMADYGRRQVGKMLDIEHTGSQILSIYRHLLHESTEEIDNIGVAR